jgi:hypothetical protein
MLTHIIKPSPRPVAGLDEIVLSDGTRLGVRPIEPATGTPSRRSSTRSARSRAGGGS